MSTERVGAVVIGGANVDIKARSASTLVPGTSNPGHTVMSAGGVGRNIAENLARLGTDVHLVTAVGRDPLGDHLLRETATCGVRLNHVLRADAATGTYTAVLGANGELVAGIADMTVIAALGLGHLRSTRILIAGADLLILDGNLSVEALAYAIDLAGQANVRVILDPVSDPKAQRLASLVEPTRPMFLMTPNRTELEALTGQSARTAGELDRAAVDLHRRGVANVWVRLGADGSMFRQADGTVTHLPARAAEVRDVTGAGDAMAAAFAHALLCGRDLLDAARFAHAAAALTISQDYTVRPDLSADLVERELRRGLSPPQPDQLHRSTP